MRASRHVVALAAALLVVVMLAGCGQTVKAHASATTVNVHAASTAVRGGPFVSLHAVRSSAFPENNIPTFDHTGADPTAIATLYEALAALKPWPPGTYFCPLDIGLLYHLTFTRADGTRVTGEAKPDGCQYASLNGGIHGQLVDENGFWSLFAAAVDVPVSALQYQP